MLLFIFCRLLLVSLSGSRGILEYWSLSQPSGVHRRVHKLVSVLLGRQLIAVLWSGQVTTDTSIPAKHRCSEKKVIPWYVNKWFVCYLLVWCIWLKLKQCSLMSALIFPIQLITEDNMAAEGGGLLRSDLVSCFSSTVSGGRGAWRWWWWWCCWGGGGWWVLSGRWQTAGGVACRHPHPPGGRCSRLTGSSDRKCCWKG